MIHELSLYLTVMDSLQIVPTDLLDQYRQQVDEAALQTSFDQLKDAEISTETFSFYTSISAITSSRIEGEKMEVDSYLKHKMLGVEYEPDLVQKPDDLYRAYIFAQQNNLTVSNFLEAHGLLAAHLLPPHKRGKFRTGSMVVLEHKTGRIQFEAASARKLNELMQRLWTDINDLTTRPLTYTEVFYFASIIHLVFVCIHPFLDGNGRAGRLLEKWFIAEKLGTKAWYLQSEQNYHMQVSNYYSYLNRLGVFYDELDYNKALPFLLLLPKALNL